MAKAPETSQTTDAIRAIRRGTYGMDQSPRTALADPKATPAPTLKVKLAGVNGNA